MALTLNTSHPLYSALVELIGIDTVTGQLASAKVARTFTTLGSASYPTASGTYGKAARSVTGGGAFSFTPRLEFNNAAATIVVAYNSVTVQGTGNVRQLISSTRERTPMVQIRDDGKAALGYEYNQVNVLATGTSNVSSGAHVIAVTHGSSGGQVYVDGALEGTGTTVLDPQNPAWLDHVGGVPGFNGIGADIVWAAVFNRVLTGAEIASLTSSVAPNNVIGLLDGAPIGGTPTVSSVTVSPAAPQVAGGTTQQFTATVTGTNNPGQGVTWSFSPNTSGASINSSGVFTAPAATASQQTFTITATSSVDNTKSGSTTATVPATGAPPVTYTGVSVTPSTATVVGLATQQFSATVSGTGAFSNTVTWSVDGTGNGSINSSGLYTAPAAGVSARNVVVRATAANGSTAGTAAVTVPAATGAGSFVTEAMVNNTGQVLANTSVRWSWFPAGRIGAFAGITPVEGVATTNAQGQLTATGLATGAGLLVAAQWINGATDDVVFYQAGTVA